VRWSEGQGPYRCGMLMCWRVLQEMPEKCWQKLHVPSTYRKFDISACGGLVHTVICPQHAEETLTCITLHFERGLHGGGPQAYLV
jgi:hypothetical protein